MAYKFKIIPRAEREATIKNRHDNAKEFGEIIYDFRSGSYTPKVISLPIGMPVYRMENCRAFTAQQNEIATLGLDNDFFAKGQELTTAQQAQHDILVELAKQSSSSGTTTSIYDVLQTDGQREPILITSSGVVVNGNRRLGAMRELMRQKDGSVDERFTHIRCAVLPSDTTRDEIDDIEADLQARPQTKLDYDWIGDARLISRQVNKGRTPKEVADRLRRSKVDIENVLQALDEADLYLKEWVKKPGQYHLLKDGEQIFSDIPKNIANKDPHLQEASRAIAWSIYENRERVVGRVYRLNAAFGKLAPRVLDILEDKINFEKVDKEYPGVKDDFAVDINVDADTDHSDKNYKLIIQTLKDDDTKDDAVNVLLEACETAIEFARGEKNEQAPLKTLSQVHARIIGIDANAAGENTLTPMLNQIDAIRNALDKIVTTIHTRQTSKSSDNKTEE